MTLINRKHFPNALLQIHWEDYRLTCPFPATMFGGFPRLQFLRLRNNPGLTVRWGSIKGCSVDICCNMHRLQQLSPCMLLHARLHGLAIVQCTCGSYSMCLIEALRLVSTHKLSCFQPLG